MRAAAVAMSLLGCAVACGPARARAGTLGLAHERSIYADAKGRRLESPEGVACTEGGRLVVADTAHGRLLTFGWREGQLGGGEEIRLPQLPRPTRVQLDGAGSVLVLDGKLRRIARLDGEGRFAGYLDLAPRGPPAEVTPIAFKVAASGEIHVLDAAGRRVLVASAAGRIAREIPLPRAGSFTDVAVGPGGKVWVIDAASATLWVAEPAGAFRPAGPSLRGRLRFPAELALDPRGRLFVVDRNGDALAAVGPDGSVDGPALASGRGDGLLSYPAQICVTRGLAFVADRGNHRVQVFSFLR